MGSIFCMDGVIHLCDGGLTVRVRSRVYHERMANWIAERMPRPLVWIGENGTHCTMTAPAGAGEVVIELAKLEKGNAIS